MEKVNEVFFSEKGLTSTSASHLADLAQETILGNETKLKNMSFITTKVDIVGSLCESGKTVSLGYDEKSLSEVKGLLEEIAEMNAFCAWMREAIKAKEREIQQINRCSFDEWCQSFGYPVIEKTELPKEICAEDLIAEMNVKERNCYFTLEAIAATIGKYIHPGGKFSDAREELLTKTMKPYTADGTGKDTLIYSHTASVSQEKVEEVFFELQKIHRQNERELNRIKFALKRESDRLNLESQQKYKSELEKASLQYKRIFTQYKEWQIKESDRISKLKIIIPDALQTTYEKLSLLEE